MGNPFVHIELQTADVKKARDFYSKLFKWKLRDMPMGEVTYTGIDVGEGTGGGMMVNASATPAQWLPYAQVSDVEKFAARAAELGGKVLAPPTEVDGMGEFAIISDPTGGVLGIWKARASRARQAAAAKKAPRKTAPRKTAARKTAPRKTRARR